MNAKRTYAMFRARNKEFFRDRGAFGWNFIFPFLIIIGFGIIFSGRDMQRYKIGVFPMPEKPILLSKTSIPERFFENRAVQFVPITTKADGLEKIALHKIDLLLDGNARPLLYWVNESSPNGYIAEQLLVASLTSESDSLSVRQSIAGMQTRYIDWFFPGLMAMNMMFSALWGVGYIVVRYRKNGALKRLKATPLTAFEYLTAQLLSRIFLLMFTFTVVWLGSDLIFNFHMQGSVALFLFVFVLGGLSLCALGLVLAARGTSEEFTSGVLNFIAWPMMFLSEVWFSLEGAPQWLQQLSWCLPLTHLLKAARKVMNEGAGLYEIRLECILMLITTILLLSLAAYLFSWNE